MYSTTTTVARARLRRRHAAQAQVRGRPAAREAHARDRPDATARAARENHVHVAPRPAALQRGARAATRARAGHRAGHVHVLREDRAVRRLRLLRAARLRGCARRCGACDGLFCAVCSTVDYQARYERVVCLSCAEGSCAERRRRAMATVIIVLNRRGHYVGAPRAIGGARPRKRPRRRPAPLGRSLGWSSWTTTATASRGVAPSRGAERSRRGSRGRPSGARRRGAAASARAQRAIATVVGARRSVGPRHARDASNRCAMPPPQLKPTTRATRWRASRRFAFAAPCHSANRTTPATQSRAATRAPAMIKMAKTVRRVRACTRSAHRLHQPDAPASSNRNGFAHQYTPHGGMGRGTRTQRRPRWRSECSRAGSGPSDQPERMSTANSSSPMLYAELCACAVCLVLSRLRDASGLYACQQC